MKTNTAITAMIVAFVAMIGMTGFAAAGSNMNYDVDFAAVGTGSVQINTFTPDGIDVQAVTWSGCNVLGYQDGDYSQTGTWSKIDRTTTIHSEANTAVDALIQTQTTVNSAPGYEGSTVTAVAKLEDGSVVNAPEDYIILGQTTYFQDTGNLEKIVATTGIDGRVFNHGGSNDPMALGQVTGKTDGTSNASSSILVDLSMGQFDLDVTTRVTDDPANIESAGTRFVVAVPDMSNMYTEQADGMVVGYTAIDGVMDSQLISVFENVDTFDATGYLYAVTP